MADSTYGLNEQQIAEARQLYKNIFGDDEKKVPVTFDAFLKEVAAEEQNQQTPPIPPPPSPSLRERLTPSPATIIRAAGPIVGGALGTVALPGPGSVAGAAAGGIASEGLAELLSGQDLNLKQMGVSGLLSVLPVPFLGRTTAATLRSAPFRAMGREAIRGAALGGAGNIGTGWATGKSAKDVAEDMPAAMMGGALTGGAFTGAGAGAQRLFTPALKWLAERGYSSMFPPPANFSEQVTKATQEGGSGVRPSSADLPTPPARIAAQLQLPAGWGTTTAQQNIAQQIANRTAAIEDEIQKHIPNLDPVKLTQFQKSGIRDALGRIIDNRLKVRSEQSATWIRSARALQQKLQQSEYSAADALDTKRFLDRFNKSISKPGQPAEAALESSLRDNANLLRAKLHADPDLSKMLDAQQDMYALSEAMTQGLQRGRSVIPTDKQSLLRGPSLNRLYAGIGRRAQALTGLEPPPIPMAPAPIDRSKFGKGGIPYWTQFRAPGLPSPARQAGPVPPGPVEAPIYVGPEFYTTRAQRLGFLLPPGRFTVASPTGPVPAIREGSGAAPMAEVIGLMPSPPGKEQIGYPGPEGKTFIYGTKGVIQTEAPYPIFGSQAAPGQPSPITQGMPSGAGRMEMSPEQARQTLAALTEVLKLDKGRMSKVDRDFYLETAKQLKLFLRQKQ